MRDVIDIDGSFFIGSEKLPHLWRYLTPDGRYLTFVTGSVGEIFRAHVCERKSGAPQWRGTWWTEIEQPSLTGSLDDAVRLVRERLQVLYEPNEIQHA